MKVPWLYRISRFFVRLGLRAYFHRVEVTGREHLPAGGPVIFASNHPHSIADALVLGYGVGRMLHFVAHSGLFRVRWKAWFLRSSGVIPVYRPQDVEQASDRNLNTFAACHEVLAAGGAIGIFPEGTSSEERRVQKLKTGTVRIAFGAEAEHDWNLGVIIVPVGLNFESRKRFRSRVLIRFGKPFTLKPLRESYEEDPMATVARLTTRLQEEMRQEVINVDHDEYLDLVRGVEKVYKGELLEREGLAIAGGSRFQRDQNVTREIGRALDFFYKHHPELIWGLSRQMQRYHQKRRLLRLKDDMLRQEKGPTMTSEVWRFVVVGACGLLPAGLGLVGNFLPYRLTSELAPRLAPDLTKVHTYQFSIGAVLFLPWYTWLIYLAAGILPTLGTVVFGLLLAPAGLLARHYLKYLTQRRRMLRLAGLELLQGVRIQQLRQQRSNLVKELDAALDVYMNSRKERN